MHDSETSFCVDDFFLLFFFLYVSASEKSAMSYDQK